MSWRVLVSWAMASVVGTGWCAGRSDAGETLFPFVLPWDDATPGVTDLSGWLEKPVGRSGHVRVGEDGHLYAGAERIRFYGGSFVADPWGNVVTRASLSRPEIVYADLDLSQIQEARSFFGFLDTRRPETYGALTRGPRATPRNQGGAA